MYHLLVILKLGVLKWLLPGATILIAFNISCGYSDKPPHLEFVLDLIVVIVLPVFATVARLPVYLPYITEHIALILRGWLMNERDMWLSICVLFLNKVIPIDYMQLRGLSDDACTCKFMYDRTQNLVWFSLFHLQMIDRTLYYMTQRMFSNFRVCVSLSLVQVMDSTQFP